MTTIRHICEFLEQLAPLSLAESWDNVGLLIGDAERKAARVMTCLTVTPATAEEAIGRGADLIVTHHPFPFRPLVRITADRVSGRMLLRLVEAGVAVYSPHTALDSAARGINVRLAEAVGVVDAQPLLPLQAGDGQLGAGRWGRLREPCEVAQIVDRVKTFLKLSVVRLVGDPQRVVRSVAVACGSGGELLPPAIEKRCELFLTGELSFHRCLEAESEGMAVVLTGHYASERFAVEELAAAVAGQFADLEVWASRSESDPLQIA